MALEKKARHGFDMLRKKILKYIFPNREIESPIWLAEWNRKHSAQVKKSLLTMSIIVLFIEVFHLFVVDRSLNLQPIQYFQAYRLTISIMCLGIIALLISSKSIKSTSFAIYFWFVIGVTNSVVQACSINWCIDYACGKEIPIFFVGIIISIHVLTMLQPPRKALIFFTINSLLAAIPLVNDGQVLEYLSVSSAGFALVAAGSLYYNLSLALFISQKKTEYAMESLKLMDEHKNEFIQNISHELRTPLTLLSGPLEQSYKEDSNNEKILVALKNAKRIENLVDQFLEYQSSIMSTNSEKFSYFGLGSVIHHCVECFKDASYRRHIELSIEANKISLTGKNQPVIYGSPEYLQKIIFNYLSNAFKYTPNNGSILIKIIETESSEILLSINDSGDGIAQHELLSIFNLFEKGANLPKTQNRSGSGLGLAIVKRLAEAMNGEVGAASEPGYGSSFWVKLPLIKDIKGKQPNYSVSLEKQSIGSQNHLHKFNSPKKSSKVRHLNAQGEKILVVDGEEDMRSYLTLLLTDQGYQVKVAENREEALKALKIKDISLVISELWIEKTTGQNLVSELRKNERTAGIPVIILSSRMQPSDRAASFEHGSSFFMSKPFNQTELISVVRNMLLLKSGEKEAERRQEQTQTLLRVLTHDLSNTSMLISSALNPPENRDRHQKQKEQITERGKRAIKRQMDIIESIRNLDSLDSGKRDLTLQPVIIADLYLEIQDIFSDKLKEKEISLQFNNKLPIGHRVQAEPVSLLNSVLCNIISNSIKFSMHRENILITAEEASEETKITISDKGIGIPESIKSVIFSPTAATTRKGTDGEQGTGFGLPLVKKYVTKYGGRIELESICIDTCKHNHGTTFIIHLLSSSHANKKDSNKEIRINF